MGTIRPAGKVNPVRKELSNGVKLIAGFLSSNPASFSTAGRLLEKRFGRIDFESEVLDFEHTGYYKEEMGDRLKRKFVGFADPVNQAAAYKSKIVTNRIERHLSRGGRRTVNIDPGYISRSKLVLFSTKDYSHRIYMGKGIYAEVTLYYADKKFNPWPWTYPDYKTAEYLGIFEALRKAL